MKVDFHLPACPPDAPNYSYTYKTHPPMASQNIYVHNIGNKGKKKSPSKGVFIFFPSSDANFHADWSNFWQPARKG